MDMLTAKHTSLRAKPAVLSCAGPGEAIQYLRDLLQATSTPGSMG